MWLSVIHLNQLSLSVIQPLSVRIIGHSANVLGWTSWAPFAAEQSDKALSPAEKNNWLTPLNYGGLDEYICSFQLSHTVPRAICILYGPEHKGHRWHHISQGANTCTRKSILLNWFPQYKIFKLSVFFPANTVWAYSLMNSMGNL